MDLRRDQAQFFGKLAALMEAGIPLLRAFEVAADRVRDDGLRYALGRILDRAYQGSSIADSFESEAPYFSSEARCLLAQGEETGDIEKKAAAISEGLASGIFEPGRPGEEISGPEGSPLDRLISDAVEAGATAVIEPGGSKKDADVIARAEAVAGTAGADPASLGTNPLITGQTTFLEMAASEPLPAAAPIPTLETPDGEMGIAAALALNIAVPDAESSINAGTSLAATGEISVTAEADHDAIARADATAIDTATGIGAAVALNIAVPAAESWRPFLEGLRERGLDDMALLYLDRMAADPDCPADLKEVLDYEAGVTLLTGSRSAGLVALQERALDDARARFKKFLAAYPNHAMASPATNQLARIVSAS